MVCLAAENHEYFYVYVPFSSLETVIEENLV